MNYPKTENEIWWEIWLRKEKHNEFESIASKLDIQVDSRVIEFEERDVCIIKTTPKKPK